MSGMPAATRGRAPDPAPGASDADASAAAARASESRHAFLLALYDRLRPISDPLGIQDEAARMLARHLGAIRVGYAEDAGDGESIVVTREHVEGAPSIQGPHRYADYGSTLLADLTTGRTVVRADVPGDPTLTDEERTNYAALGIGSMVDVPLVRDGRAIVVLFVHTREPRAWEPAELALIEDVAARTWDAVERARAESAVREREASLQLALGIADVGTWSIDLATGAGEMSERGAAIVGLAAGPVPDIAAAQRDSIHPDDLPRIEAELAAGIAAGEPFTLEYRVTHPDGSLHHVLSRGQVVLGPSGVPERVLGTNRDVTAERAAEAALREREARYRLLFDSMDQGFCVLEMLFDDAGRPVDYRFLEVNPAFERQTGLRDAVGRTARELVPGLEPSWVDVYGTVARTGIARRFTNEAASMGRTFDVFALRIGPPELAHVALLFTDVTDRARADAERDASLERERHAREAAEAFLAVMSHELRTPVTSIFGTATILARDPGRHDLRELVGDIGDEAERLRRIIDDLLVLSGVERGLLRLSPEPVLLQHAVSQVVGDLRRRYPDVELLVHLERGMSPVIADTTALRQVLFNLVSNAAKYAGPDGPVTIEAAERDGLVEVAIRDVGPGLGDDPAALFGLFYRAPHTAKRASGTGIGLYVAEALLQALGSRVEAANRPTGGAEFRFTLPTVDTTL